MIVVFGVRKFELVQNLQLASGVLDSLKNHFEYTELEQNSTGN
jgi:hypothetical protein